MLVFAPGEGWVKQVVAGTGRGAYYRSEYTLKILWTAIKRGRSCASS